MVNPDTGMLEYLYFPQTDAFVRERCPIREIASVWDMERVSHFLNWRELFPLVEKSLRHYEDYLVEREGFLILDPGRLAEPSSIAHSAFMILALTGAPAPRKIRQITALADGILRQQRPDGSYKVYFHDLPDQGEELSPARILARPYPATRVFASGFEKVRLPRDYFDLIVSNVPFANVPVHDPETRDRRGTGG